MLPGVIGTIQATEALKLVLGAGSTLVGRLLLYDAWSMKFRELKLRRDPACPICGDHPSIKGLIDYEEFCGIPQAAATTAAAPGVPETTVQELKARFDAKAPFFLLDVREPHEYQISRIAGSTLIPLGQLPSRLAELPSGQEIIVHCKSGARSAKAVDDPQGERHRGQEPQGRHPRLDRQDRSDAGEGTEPGGAKFTPPELDLGRRRE